MAALCALATHAVAEEQAATPDPAAVEPPRFFFDLGWDYGPTYEFGQRFPTLERYEWAEPAQKVHVQGRLGAILHLDGGALAGDALPDGPRFEVRRARFLTRGEALLLLRTEYKIEFAVEAREVYLNDFFVRWRPRRFVDTIRIGYFDPPISLEALTGSADRSLMETGAPVSAFAPGFRLGAEVTGSRSSPSLNWNLNLSSVGQSQPNAEATSSSVLRVVGRLAARPLGDMSADAGRHLLHLGISASQVVSGSGDLQYRARPETFLTPYLLDTDTLDGNATVLGLESAWRRGPLSVQAEYLHAFVDAEDEGSLDFEGATLLLDWVLTGESRPYDLKTGVFGRVSPDEPYKPFQGHWGAFELAARASWLDLSDGPVSGGRMFTATLGPTWTWNRWVRLLAGYVYAHISDSPRGSDAHIFQARLELRI